MRRTAGVSTPKYRLHRASGQAVVTIAGRDHYLGPHGTKASRLEYDRLIGEWLANGRTIGEADRGLTVVELIAAYHRHAAAYYRRLDGTPTYEVANIKLALRPLKELYGTIQAGEFGPLALQAVRHRMIATGWCRTNINRNVGRIKQVFKWAVAQQLIPAAVFHGLQAVAGLQLGRSGAKESEPVKPVPQAFIDAVLPRVSPPVAAMIRLQLLTAARPGELLVLRGCDLETSGPIWTYSPALHKTAYRGHKRTIYLGPQAQAIVKPFLSTSLTAFLFSPRAAKEAYWAERRANRKTPMTPSQAKRRRKQNPKRSPGDSYTIYSYRCAIARACREAGVPEWGPHRLRHNAATLLRKQFGLEKASRVMEQVG
jgi:integrase